MRRSGKAAGVLTVVLVLVVLVVLLGFWRNWFQFESTESPNGERTNLTLEVDKAAIEADRERAETTLRRGAEELEQKAEAIREIETVQGTVTRVDAAARSLTVAAEEGPAMTFSLDGETQVTRSDEATTLSDIREGDRVVVVYRAGDEGAKLVQEVNVVEASQP